MSQSNPGTQGQSYQPISSYAIIGDCHTAALVGQDGAIDWYCPHRFDEPAVFCRLLDAGKGGFYSISPSGAFSATRHYLDETNILRTVFTAGGAQSALTDFMPVHRRKADRRGYDVGTSRRILRLVEAISGDVELVVRFHPTMNYGRSPTTLKVVHDSIAVATNEGQYLSLACPGHGLSFATDDAGGLSASLSLRAGERRWLVLTDSDDPDRAVELPEPSQCEEQLSRTTSYWKQWAGACTYQGPYRDMVLRSALTLKLLTYEPTGAIVAAPTTSLPEEIGGVRNWDYRYAWLRDSALILSALLTTGYEEEAADFFEWLQETHKKDPTPEPQVLYGIDGRDDIPETTLDNLAGYRDSRPVRVGNGAALQTQHDIYGEILTAASLYFELKIGEGADSVGSSPSRRSLSNDWPLLRSLVQRAAELWQQPDNGIWETRGGLQHFLYSRLMCWAALDRGIRLASEYSLPAPLDEWLNIRKAIEQTILGAGYDVRLGAFTQATDSPALDASALIIPRVGLLPPTDSRIQSTVRRIQSELTRGGLVYRYTAQDGLPGSEAAFLTCTFWLVDVLATSGQFDAADDLFKHAAGYANDVGLMSEEVEPSTRELLGNFPQGFSHMALINAAVNLANAQRHGPEEQPETEVERARKTRRPLAPKPPAPG